VKALHQKRFLHELANITSPIRSNIEKFAFEDILKLNSVEESGKIERMKGYRGYYKVRFGDYRVGIKVEGDTVIFERVKNRKDIYKFFP
jgi:mRNA interferase RelE/StbE